MTITGTNFTGRHGGDSSAARRPPAFTVNSATSITATSPAGSAGTVDVTVTTPGGTSATSAADQFTYLTPAPTVTGVSPTTGPTAGGTSVTITGTNFTGATAVSFGGTAATPFTVDQRDLDHRDRAGAAAGTVDVTVTTPERHQRDQRRRSVHLRGGPDGDVSVSPTSGPDRRAAPA